MGNKTIDVLNSVFIMAEIKLTLEGKLWTVVIGSFIYFFIMFCNLSLLAVIAVSRSLHGPMYVFLSNLVINDMIGLCAIIPRVMSDVLSEHRYISFPACLIQAFCLHMYGGATLFILSVMAFDRYVAICHPLRYHTIMTKGTVMSLIASIWLSDFVLVGVLFGLMLRFPFCKTVLVNVYCDNVSLLRITCATDTRVNNIYGLFITGVFHGIAVLSIVFSYACILYTCFKNNSSGAKAKALNTCVPHLLVFAIYEFTGIFIVLVYRIRGSPVLLQTFMAMLFVIVPPGLNPLIYGMKTKEIQVKVRQFFSRLIGTGCQVKINTVTM